MTTGRLVARILGNAPVSTSASRRRRRVGWKLEEDGEPSPAAATMRSAIGRRPGSPALRHVARSTPLLASR